MKIILLFTLFSFSLSVCSQVDLHKEEIVLDSMLNAMRNEVSFDQKIEKNNIFKTHFNSILTQNNSHNYSFTKLKSVSIINSSDKKITIVSWNILSPDDRNLYYGFLVVKNKKQLYVYELIDQKNNKDIPKNYVKLNKWYGCIYYDIIPKKIGSKTIYTLLGFDGNNQTSNYKIIDVLSFVKNKPILGLSIFKNENKKSKRAVFEYSDKAVMMMKHEKKYKRIIFDHLSPQSPNLKGLYSFYVPDFSYDSYQWKRNSWNLYTDVIVVNKKDKKRKVQVLGQNKRGKIKKKKISNEWQNPEDLDAPIDNNVHIARTPESENQIIKDKKEKNKKDKWDSKKKRKWRKRKKNELYPSSIYGNSYKMRRQRK